MAGPRDTAFDLGIKSLLCGDNEDDENFWAYFSEFVDAEQPPFMLPIPPTLTLETAYAVSTAPPTTQPISLSDTTGTYTVDNHYQLHILSDIQNTIDKKPLNDRQKKLLTNRRMQTLSERLSDLRK